MVYSPNIPASTDNPSASQSLIQANFNALNTDFGVDHVNFTAASNNGMHNKVTWLDQHLAPPTSAATQVVAYSSTNTAITMPYYTRDGLPTVFSLSPIKGYISLKINSTILATSLDAFNITIVSVTGTAALLHINFAITNAMLSMTNYGVLISLSMDNPANPLEYFYENLTSTSFTVTIRNSAITASSQMTVALLEF